VTTSPGSTPSVLYVVPTLGRRPEYLARTVDSLLAQDGPRVGVVLVAPASATHLSDLAAERDVLLLTQDGTGMSSAINQGWREHGGDYDYWSWLGDDDELAPSSTRLAVDYLQRRPRAVMVYGRCDYIDAEGRLLFEARPSSLAARLMRWGPDLVPQPGSIARADAVRAAGWIDESLRYAMDLDLFLRLADHGRIGYTPHVLARFRWHDESTTVGAPDASNTEARRVRARTWVGRRKVGFLTERPAMLAGRVLHKAQRGFLRRRT
jgi:GT2 family glycosyltransferase